MVIRCKFCQQLFEGCQPTSFSSQIDWDVCPSCKQTAKSNTNNFQKQNSKKLLENDGFFDKKDFLSEEYSNLNESFFPID